VQTPEESWGCRVGARAGPPSRLMVQTAKEAGAPVGGRVWRGRPARNRPYFAGVGAHVEGGGGSAGRPPG